MTRAALAFALAAALGACLEVGPDADVMCRSSDDCNAGEVCEENICWGNPPAGPFAAVISPPSERNGELVSRELLWVPITDDGWLEELRLDNEVTYQGELQALCPPPLECDGRSFGASITITRRSPFVGGPGVRKVVTVKAGEGTFQLKLPATRPGAGMSLAQLVPPLHAELVLPSSSTANVIELGGFDLPTVSGTVTGSSGQPLANYRVVALGRWRTDGPLAEVSTVDFTGSDGAYAITLSRGVVDTVEIVARPWSGTKLRPELHLGSIAGDRDSMYKQLSLATPTEGTEVPIEIVVDHKEASGEITAVAGARVLVTASVPTYMNATARLAVEGTTDANGSVKLAVLDSFAGSYRVSIIPPASTNAAALYDKPLAWQAWSNVRLGTRLPLTGVVLDADGEPLKDVLVTARPSVRFLWSLEAAPQAFLGAIPAATALTSNTGEFVLFVDHSFTNPSAPQGGTGATVWGHYDLAFDPPIVSWAPPFTRTDVELPRDATQSSFGLGAVQLPDAAHLRGRVFDGQGTRLAGAEVKVYRVDPDLSVCADTRFEPASCPVPALVLGRGASDADGIVRLTLPR